MRHVPAERLVALVVLADDPQDIVVVEHAPDGGEGIAKAEVDAAQMLHSAFPG
jgi:hypothetical protein